MSTAECIVIGGGVIGMATARALALQGRSVALFDKGRVGAEASWAAGGILSSMRPWSEPAASAALSAAGQACYPQFVAALERETGIETEYDRLGLLMIGHDDVDLTKRWALLRRVPFVETADRLPTGFAHPERAVLLPEIAAIKPPKLLQALSASLRKHGVAVFEHSSASLDLSGDQCRAVIAGGVRHVAGNVIITAGAWSGRVLNTHAAIRLKPIRGQMLCVKSPAARLATIVLDEGHYFIPRRDGHLLIGSTMEDVGFDKHTTGDARRQLMAWAVPLWHDLIDAPLVRQWAGLRPAATEPYIGKVPGYKNLYVNAGHFRKGILQAPVAADQIAAMITG